MVWACYAIHFNANFMFPLDRFTHKIIRNHELNFTAKLAINFGTFQKSFLCQRKYLK